LARKTRSKTQQLNIVFYSDMEHNAELAEFQQLLIRWMCDEIMRHPDQYAKTDDVESTRNEVLSVA